MRLGLYLKGAEGSLGVGRGAVTTPICHWLVAMLPSGLESIDSCPVLSMATSSSKKRMLEETEETQNNRG